MIMILHGNIVFDPTTTPYQIEPAEFPHAGTPGEQYEFLLRYAILAPSTHNTQPWKFAIRESGVEIYADYTRRVPVADPDDRELFLSLGAAIFNLRVAAAHFGFRCRVSYDTGGDPDGPVAAASLSGGVGQDASQIGALFPFIVKRRTNRNPFLLSRVPNAAVEAFPKAGDWGEASLVLSRDGLFIERVATLVAEADRVQFADSTFRREVAEWLRPTRRARADGIPGSTLGTRGVAAALAPWAMKVLDLGRLRAAHDRYLCIEAPGLIVVVSEDNKDQWLESGELLEHTLLTAAKEGLQCSYFNMPIQVANLRRDLRKLLGLSAWPQLLLRIGYCLMESEPTPRRPLEEVLIP
jgi:hypothetical protein